MMRVDINNVSNTIQEVAEQIILPRFRNLGANDIAFKIGDDPVTIADKEAEIALSARLLDLLPGSKVVGEEAFSSNQSVFDSLFSESPVWIIDPIDGTRNFVRGSSEFGVIVALAEQNQTIAGWIYDPTSKEVITTEKGSGAWYKGQKLSVLPPTELQNMHGFLGDRLMDFYKKSNSFKEIEPVFNVMTAGSHEYPQLLLNRPHFGKNRPQVHFRASYMYATPWDDAAGILMHQEAGGYSAYWNGDAYRPSDMNKGVALAPSKDSWLELRHWVQSFCELQIEKAA
jgi:fructose-1,6-bisphosphatase/inositol monophosphatase family enzyme